ncbi:MAG: hypothetical protein ABFS34_00965 [Gemmatimonadota bacterium]
MSKYPTGAAVLLAGLAMIVTTPAVAQQDHEVDHANVPVVLERGCEVAIALAASPDHLREEAGVWAYDGEGFVRHRESGNGFDCIVNRDHARALKPVCFDAEGARTIVPKIRRFGELLAQGQDPGEINASIEATFERGEFESPARPGVAFMLSNYNRPAGANGVGWFPPHVMYYAPNLTNADIGFAPGTARGVPGLPFVAYQGPQGYLVALDSRAAEQPRTALPECEGQVDPPPQQQ